MVDVRLTIPVLRDLSYRTGKEAYEKIEPLAQGWITDADQFAKTLEKRVEDNRHSLLSTDEERQDELRGYAKTYWTLCERALLLQEQVRGLELAQGLFASVTWSSHQLSLLDKLPTLKTELNRADVIAQSQLVGLKAWHAKLQAHQVALFMHEMRAKSSMASLEIIVIKNGGKDLTLPQQVWGGYDVSTPSQLDAFFSPSPAASSSAPA